MEEKFSEVRDFTWSPYVPRMWPGTQWVAPSEGSQEKGSSTVMGSRDDLCVPLTPSLPERACMGRHAAVGGPSLATGVRSPVRFGALGRAGSHPLALQWRVSLHVHWTQTCHPSLSAFCQQASHVPKLCRKQEAPSVRGQPSDSTGDDHPAVPIPVIWWGHGPRQIPPLPLLPWPAWGSAAAWTLSYHLWSGMARLCWGQVFIYLS